MKELLKKIGMFLKLIYGYGIMICLFAGGFTFFGYLAAFFIGGEVATQICVVIYKSIIPVIVYISSVLVVLGLLSMYLCGEMALSIKDSNKNK